MAFNDTDVYYVSQDYLNEPHIKDFINDVESYIDMSEIDSYADLEKRLRRFFRKKGSNEPYKHQIDIFAQFYGISPKKKTKRQKQYERVISKPQVEPSIRDGRQERAKIRDEKEGRVYIEPILKADVKMRYKGKTTFHKNREVIQQRHIPDRMAKKGYKYVLRDRKTGRYIKWVK